MMIWLKYWWLTIYILQYHKEPELLTYRSPSIQEQYEESTNIVKLGTVTRQCNNDQRDTLRFRQEASIEWQGLAGLKTDKMLKLKSDEETFINPQVGPWVQRGFWNLHNLISLIMVYAFHLPNLPDDGRWCWERTRFLDVDWKCMPSTDNVSPQNWSSNNKAAASKKRKS